MTKIPTKSRNFGKKNILWSNRFLKTPIVTEVASQNPSETALYSSLILKTLNIEKIDVYTDWYNMPVFQWAFKNNNPNFWQIEKGSVGVSF